MLATKALDEDSPAKPDEKSEKAFNYDLAVKAFGEKYMKRLESEQEEFQGDWFQLAFLLRCHETKIEKRGIDEYEVCLCPFCQFGWKCIHLENTWLPEAQLEHANLANAHLENVMFDFASLEKTKFSGAHLENAQFRNADLEFANLCKAHLKNAQFMLAFLHQAWLMKADLDGARLDCANLENADLKNAILTRTVLADAKLDGTDVRAAKGIVFDSNRVERLLIEGNAPDPWSVLRRNYTGPNFFFHLLILMAFFLPFTSKAIVLTGVHEGMEMIDKKGMPALEKLEQSTDYGKSLYGAVDKTAEKFSITGGIVETLHEKSDSKIDAFPSISSPFLQLQDWWDGMKKQTAFWTLVGYSNNNFGTFAFFLVTLMMIAYNIVRLILTREVSFLRDAEERSKITPSRKEYMGETDRQFDSQSFLVVFWEAWKLWTPDFMRWRKIAIPSWRVALYFTLWKLWDTEVWVWQQRKSLVFYIVTAIVVAIYAGFYYLDEFFLWLFHFICLIGVVGGIFGIVKRKGKDKNEVKWVDFGSNLFPPSPIKYIGLFHLHQIANVFMIVAYCALVFQICRWLWFTQIPTY